jgi:hypothetical protein
MELSLEHYRKYWTKSIETAACFQSDLSFYTMKAGAMDQMILASDQTFSTMISGAIDPMTLEVEWIMTKDIVILKIRCH